MPDPSRSIHASGYIRQPALNWRLVCALGLSFVVHFLAILWLSVETGRTGAGYPAIGVPLSVRLPSAARLDSDRGNTAVEPASAAGKEPETTGVVPRDEPANDAPPELPGAGGGLPREKEERAPGVRYFASELLTVRPYPLTALENPEGLEKVPDDLSGKLVLKVWISDAGEVSATEIEFSEMPVPIAEAMVSAFRRMRFRPGEIDGKRVGCIMRIEMTYEDFRLPVM